AAKAKRLLGCPWLADFRDPWGRNPMMNQFVKRTVSTADALSTISEPLAMRLSATCPGTPTEWITNGFDPDDFLAQRPPLTRQYSITYTGQLYEGKRDPTILL